MSTHSTSRGVSQEAELSLIRLLDPEVLADPYPLYRELRSAKPVHWDPYLHAWVLTRYVDVQQVLTHFSANRTPSAEQLSALGIDNINPVAEVMVRQMLFRDPPAHTRLRTLAACAFTPARVSALRDHIQDICDRLIDGVSTKGEMDVISDLAAPLPAIVTSELLGVPIEDHQRLKNWSADFAEMLGNFQHNPDHAKKALRAIEEMTEYFKEAISEQRSCPREGLIHSFLSAEVNGDRFTDEEVIANTIVTMVGGLETTTNLIGNGLLTLLRHPEKFAELRGDSTLIPGAVEELLRFESPSQHTARITPEETVIGGQQIRKRDAVIAVMGAANRDPERFPDPDRLDFRRPDNRHLAFGWGPHFCFGASLARIEGQVAFATILQRLHAIEMLPQQLEWRTNLGLRGLTSLQIKFEANSSCPLEPAA
jgi:cytochrome P450